MQQQFWKQWSEDYLFTLQINGKLYNKTYRRMTWLYCERRMQGFWGENTVKPKDYSLRSESKIYF